LREAFKGDAAICFIIVRLLRHYIPRNDVSFVIKVWQSVLWV